MVKVTEIQKIEFEPSIMEKLVLPDQQKDMLLSMME